MTKNVEEALQDFRDRVAIFDEAVRNDEAAASDAGDVCLAAIKVMERIAYFWRSPGCINHLKKRIRNLERSKPRA